MIVFMLYFYEITLFFEWNLRISVYIMLYLMEYLEYDYDNDIMWKPCILILTILPSLEWLPFYGNNHWLNSTSSEHHYSLDQPPPTTRCFVDVRGTKATARIPLGPGSLQSKMLKCFITGWVFNSKFMNCIEV